MLMKLTPAFLTHWPTHTHTQAALKHIRTHTDIQYTFTHAHWVRETFGAEPKNGNGKK